MNIDFIFDIMCFCDIFLETHTALSEKVARNTLTDECECKLSGSAADLNQAYLQ